MNVKELAEKILREHCTGLDTYEEALASVESFLSKALQEAVLAERERIIQITEAYGDVGREIKIRIRQQEQT